MEASRPVRWFCFSVLMNILFSIFSVFLGGRVIFVYVSIILSRGGMMSLPVWSYVPSWGEGRRGGYVPDGTDMVPEGKGV